LTPRRRIADRGQYAGAFVGLLRQHQARLGALELGLARRNDLRAPAGVAGCRQTVTFMVPETESRPP